MAEPAKQSTQEPSRGFTVLDDQQRPVTVTVAIGAPPDESPPKSSFVVVVGIIALYVIALILLVVSIAPSGG